MQLNNHIVKTNKDGLLLSPEKELNISQGDISIEISQVSKTKQVPEKETEQSLKFNCNQCDMRFKNKQGLNIHIGKSHKVELLLTPEKERITSQEDISLNTSQFECTREETDITHTLATQLSCEQP